MKKITLLGLAVLGFAGSAFASGAMPAPVSPPDYFSGFNLGANVGVQHETGNVTNDFYNTYIDTQTTPNGTSTQNFVYNYSQSSDVGNNALNGGLALGYGHTFNTSWFAGIEGFGRYAHAKNHADLSYYYNNSDSGYQEHANSSIDVKSDWSFGGDVKLGYLITPKTMFYVLAGAEYRKYSVDVFNNIITTSLGTETPYSYSYDKGKVAFMPGVGLETMLTDKLSLGARYTYANFGSLDQDYVNPTQVLGSDIEERTSTIYSLDSNSHSSAKIMRGLYSLDLTYHFNGM